MGDQETLSLTFVVTTKMVSSTTAPSISAHAILYIGQHPDKYYFNFHSVASWTYWQHHGNGSPVGMCRGVMALSWGCFLITTCTAIGQDNRVYRNVNLNMAVLVQFSVYW